ncbi:predicted protein [Lichtheimia corymbifera JMRC:FSU:9682]|uniref:Uncharacterized protein n=1 Tax=Lichtheimia corymbifera JMRC:FSU:9682 TaxID=1263082 RepID=A0A068S506_9FUNG|nr:predicted protein [Lichtheimia corymbifera JMRC:FSU:9682]
MFRPGLLFVLCLTSILPIVLGVSSHQQSSISASSQRPRHLSLDVYARGYHQDDVLERFSTSNGAVSPCWNMKSTRIGSFYVNDPMVKVTFFKSYDCTSTPAAVFRGSKDNVSRMRARSVSVQKIHSIDTL